MSHFRKWQLIATHRITRVIESPGCETRYWCKCEPCGHETGKSGARLRTIKAENPVVCGYCKSHNVKPTERLDRKASRNCGRCEGLPHRRPKHHACDCGETFCEEVVQLETYGFSAIALLGEV